MHHIQMANICMKRGLREENAKEWSNRFGFVGAVARWWICTRKCGRKNINEINYGDGVVGRVVQIFRWGCFFLEDIFAGPWE